MLEHWLIRLIGHVSGLSDAQLKQIEKSLPATKALIDLLNRARPIIEQAQNLYTEAEPLIEEAKKEWETVGLASPLKGVSLSNANGSFLGWASPTCCIRRSGPGAVVPNLRPRS
jgi:hypothetical protein